MYPIIQKRNFFFALSLLLIIPGVIAFAFWGLKPGIDFTGGTIATFDQLPTDGLEQFQDIFTQQNLQLVLQETGPRSVSTRLEALSTEQHAALTQAIRERFPDVRETAFETVGPTIGRELRHKAVSATILVLVGIVLYVTWAFRRVSVGPVRAWVYGAATIIALIHDLFVVVGVFAILGHYRGVEIDSLFVTALLTVLGFSVHDTIVVFDRIRERILTTDAGSFEQTVNESVNQTIVRSLNTSLTTLLVLFALYLFGGESIRYFTLALLIGITAGTYSSIFIASPLLVLWDRARNR